MTGRGVSKHLPTIKPLPVWSDRFREPSADELLAGLSRSHAGVLNYARTRIAEVHGTRESIEWRGVWGWTFVHRNNGQSEPAWAYLVPQPDRPRVCIPVPDDVLSGITARRLSRVVREGLSMAPAVAGVRWADWQVQSRAEVDDLMTLLDCKPQHAKA